MLTNKDPFYYDLGSCAGEEMSEAPTRAFETCAAYGSWPSGRDGGAPILASVRSVLSRHYRGHRVRLYGESGDGAPQPAFGVLNLNSRSNHNAISRSCTSNIDLTAQNDGDRDLGKRGRTNERTWFDSSKQTGIRAIY